jgi:hypothetical protein
MDLMRSLPEDSRRCSECNELAHVYPFPTDSPGPGRPFDKAAVVGCEKIIDGVIERVIEEGRTQGLEFADCFEDKKSHKSAGVSH